MDASLGVGRNGNRNGKTTQAKYNFAKNNCDHKS